MRSLKKKAASQKGASITFALLLFLVCAVVSSVIVVAASTAAGRVSQQAEVDQRYYAVSSAANLLRDEFSGKIITLKHTETTTGSTKTVGDVSIVSIANASAPATPLNKASFPVLSQACQELVGRIANGTADAEPPAPVKTLTLTTSLEDASAALNCDIKEYVSGPKKQVVYTLGNTPAAAGDPVYTLSLVLNASVSESRTETESKAPGGTTTKKAVVTTTVEWKPENMSIRKGAVA